MIMHLLAGIILVTGSLFFICLTVLVFAKPGMAERFFRGFASSARTHLVEQILRVLFGASLVIYSTAMWQTEVFRFVGGVIVASSVALLLCPWQWHHRFAEKIFPVFIQHMRLYAIGAFAFGALILYAVFAARLRSAV